MENSRYYTYLIAQIEKSCLPDKMFFLHKISFYMSASPNYMKFICYNM